MILDCLSPVAGPETVGPLQSAAAMAIIDAYDRKVERPFFCNLAVACMALHTAMGRLHTTNAVRGMLVDAGQPVGKEMDPVVDTLTKLAQQRQHDLTEMVKLLVQCPTENDPIS